MITVVIPVLNEAATVAEVVAYARRASGVAEVIVVDDGSVDDTADLATKAGARVITSTLLGKGASMEDGVRAARRDTVVFLDGDLSDLEGGVIERLAEPIVAGRADLVKAAFSRTGGRVTALTAKPLLQTFFPELARIEQPLGGLVAARRSLLRRIRFETDYGADVGLLIDAWAKGATIEEVPIGRIVHDSQPLAALADMAKQVVRVILDRAGRRRRLTGPSIREVAEVERHTQAELETVLALQGTARRLALFPVDGVLAEGSFLDILARRTRRTAPYEAALATRTASPADRIRVTAHAFEGVPKKAFVAAARAAPLLPWAVETVLRLRRAGYRVGVVSGGSRLVAEVFRRRVFADFGVGNLLRFRRERATGEIRLAPAMRHGRGCRVHPACTGNVVLHLRDRLGIARKDVVAVGRREEHACLLRAAGLPIAFEPETDGVRRAARGRCVTGTIAAVLDVPGVL